MPTFGQIAEKVTEIKSKLAVYEGVVLYLETNFLPSDSGEADMSFTRSDHGVVPGEHIKATIADVVDTMDDLRRELTQWESMTVQLPGAPKAAEPAEEPDKTDNRRRKKKKDDDARSSGEDQPASGQDGAGGDGSAA